jgi:hypothetical protein
MKVTQQQVMDAVKGTTYTILPDGITTICQLTLANGYTVHGESACADPTEFSKAEGEKWAWEAALRKVWPLLGYALKEKLHTGMGTNFGEALLALKGGNRVARSGWNGAGLWLTLQVPDAHSKMTLPYIYMSYPHDAKNTPGARVPWLASQTDLLAEDWALVTPGA